MTESAAILFAEVPALYAEVERRDAPGLAGRPILVGGDPSKRGKLQSASAEALERGAAPGQLMRDALVLCPEAVALRTDMKRYREVSGAVIVSLRRVAESLEPVGFGAAFLESRSTRAAPEALAEALVARVRDDLNLPLRVGIAPSKLLARLVAEQIEGSGVQRLEPDAVMDFLGPLPLARFPKVGRRTIERFAELGATTVGALLELDPADVEAKLGNHGLSILEQARGADPGRVRGARHPSTISRSETLTEPARRGAAILVEALQRLARGLEISLDHQGLRAGRVALKLEFDRGPAVTRSTTPGEALASASALVAVAERLLDRVEAEPSPIRSITLRVAGLRAGEAADRQLELF